MFAAHYESKQQSVVQLLPKYMTLEDHSMYSILLGQSSLSLSACPFVQCMPWVSFIALRTLYIHHLRLGSVQQHARVTSTHPRIREQSKQGTHPTWPLLQHPSRFVWTLATRKGRSNISVKLSLNRLYLVQGSTLTYEYAVFLLYCGTGNILDGAGIKQ